MSQHLIELLKRNPKIDSALLNSFKKAQEKLPTSERQKQGSSFHIEHPLAGKTIASTRNG